MKKLFIALAAATAFAVSGFCADPETAPAMDFDRADRSTVIDTAALNGQKFGENVRFISGVDGESIFSIRYFNAKKNEWKVFGSAKLVGFADTAFVDSNGHLGKRRWIAVTPAQDAEYKYNIAAEHKDLYVYVFPKSQNVPQSEKDKAAIFDPAKTRGKFSDNVSVVNKTKNPVEQFTVYGFNEEGGEWSKIGSVSFMSTDEDKIARTPYDKTSIFKYIAIVPKSGKSYEYKTSKSHNDFVITAIEN